MKKWFDRLLKEEDGQGMTEYGVIVGFVAALAILVMIVFRVQIGGLFVDVNEELDKTDFNPDK